MGIVGPSPHPHTGNDLIDRLALIGREWRRDNGIWCLEELRRLLDDYPWSGEARELYGEVAALTAHAFSPKAVYRLVEFNELRNAATGKVSSLPPETPRFQVISTRIREAFHQAGKRLRLADIAGNNGLMAVHWVDFPEVEQVVVLELSTTAIRIGKHVNNRQGLHFINCRLEQLPIATSTFDGAILSGILEHVLDPELLIAEAERITRPGGTVIVQVPYGGMEQRESNPWRDHIQSIDPYRLLQGKQGPYLAYLSSTSSPALPHTWDGEVGDWIISWTIKEQ